VSCESSSSSDAEGGGIGRAEPTQPKAGAKGPNGRRRNGSPPRRTPASTPARTVSTTASSPASTASKAASSASSASTTASTASSSASTASSGSAGLSAERLAELAAQVVPDQARSWKISGPEAVRYTPWIIIRTNAEANCRGCGCVIRSQGFRLRYRPDPTTIYQRGQYMLYYHLKADCLPRTGEGTAMHPLPSVGDDGVLRIPWRVDALPQRLAESVPQRKHSVEAALAQAAAAFRGL
jgi:hypothetical protein